MYSIDKLSEMCGVTRRTVRYYIQRGLLPPPEGKLKGAYYTDTHVKRLEEIKKLSEEGVPLNMMKDVFEKKVTIQEIFGIFKEEKTPELKEESHDLENIWIHIELEEGIEFHLRKDKADKINLKKLTTYIQNKLKRCHYVK